MKSLFGLLSFVSLAVGSAAADWPQFRGPDGQGHVQQSGLPTEWDAKKNVTWVTDIPGSGWSSPVVAGGKVYLTTAVAAKGDANLSLRALCLDAKTGKILWDREVFHQKLASAPPIHNKNSQASPTPIVEGDRLYVHFGHLGTACLDLDGKVLWSNRDLKFVPVHGNGGSPVLVDGLLVFSSDGAVVRQLVALDAKTGKLKWKTPRAEVAFKRFSFSTPLVIEVAGSKQIVSPGSNVVGAYDPATGKEIWKVRYHGYSVIPRPVFGHGMVFVVTGYDSSSVVAIKADGKGDVTDSHVAWTLTKGAPHTPSLLLVGDELYMVADHGLASCVDAKTGKVHWQKRLPGKGFSASPIVADGKVWFLSEDGVGTVIKAAKTYELVAKNELGERTLASYAVAPGRRSESAGGLLIRTAGRLYRIDKE